MISIRVYLNPEGRVLGVDADNHGDRLVCAAVSMLVINAANSLELLTDEGFTLDYDEDGGHLSLRLDDPLGHDAGLLLESLYLGLCTIAGEYPEELVIDEVSERGVSE